MANAAREPTTIPAMTPSLKITGFTFMAEFVVVAEGAVEVEIEVEADVVLLYHDGMSTCHRGGMSSIGLLSSVQAATKASNHSVTMSGHVRV